MAPGKKGTSKVVKHPKANTLYITIPADIVKEKEFPFSAGEIVKIELDEQLERLIISRFD